MQQKILEKYLFLKKKKPIQMKIFWFCPARNN